ncbi:MAG: hypothetical protein UX09_C0051G0003 [Candidatus Uhrbacteria bacterium GW2011_GWE2_45_35]|uniref:Uncharacterized protein n=2 Tax=Candidatus Uhriibacteriota TaxID=1752732 RepID=A0A0G1JC01_9BACT|nr:MAG: hypothetical protein UW63_C0062G0004 [Candidatus Uhrbacteria bacterium GW2011_GWF2_44_350]KKU06470.1 MAG: hypothetical protein UX09_C0051G0003 [Candidatus Uhrbacteria bacterium GW2011_GWE2_45_35]HBR80365.1 hypothetical protein [Candidatus Uhrbacteria bacterium]HCU32127.1 hypothetical protein [Candidatus Uhrbacteria bacterium]
MMDLQHLPNARAGEKVELFLRRNWTTPLEIIIYTSLLFGVPVLGLWLFNEQISDWLTTPYIGQALVLAISAYALITWLFAFLEFTDYYLDVWIVTNERIINIEQKGLFTRVASELHLTTVEDTTSEVKGMLHTFLDYGNVYVQTAGERTRFIFKNVPHPEKVKETIVRLTEEKKSKITN